MVVDDLESDNSEVRSNKSSLILHKRKAPRFGYGSVEDKNDGELQQTLQTFIRIFELAGPALASLIVEPLMITVDTFYVGRLGKESLAAMAVNTFVFNFSFFIFNFLGGIASPLVAQARAENNKEKEQKVISQLITVALFFGICVVALLLGFSNNILMAMGAEKEIFDAAKMFLQIRALSAPAVLLVHVGHGALRGNLDTRTPLGVIALANLVNFALDPVLIFGLGFGVAGAAATTTISEWIAAILFLVIFKKRLKYSIRPRLKSLVNFFFSGLLGQSSLYVFLRTLFLQAFLTSGGAVAARVSPAAMAAHQVAFQLWLLGSYASDALAVAATALVADAEGRGDRAGGRRAANVGMSIGAVVGGVAGAALCLVGGHRVAALFTPDPDVTQAIKPLTIILGLTQPLNAVVFVSDGVLQGHQQFGLQAGIMSAAVCLSGFLMLYLQKHSFGLLAVWISLCTLQLYRACGFFIYYFTTGNASPSPHQEVETNKEQHKAPQEG